MKSLYSCAMHMLVSKLLLGPPCPDAPPSGALLRSRRASVYALPAESVEPSHPSHPWVCYQYLLRLPEFVSGTWLSPFRYAGKVGETSAGHR